MMTKSIVYILLLFLVLLSNCSYNIAGKDGGGATVTTNGVVFTAEGKPAKGAFVRLVDTKNWLEKKKNNIPVVLDSAITDSNGYFSFSRDTITLCNLQIDNINESILHTNYTFIRTLDTTERFDLRKSASIQGTLLNLSSKQTSIDLYGTSYSSMLDSNNSFSIPIIAPGVYHLYINIESDLRLADTLSVFDGELITDYALDNFANIDIEYFDDNTFCDSCPTMLGQSTGGTWFLLGNESLNTDDYFKYSIDTASQIYDDLYLNLKMNIPDTNHLSRGVGFTLAKDSSFDLSGSWILSFNVHGHGNMRVVFYSKYTGDSGSPDSLHFGKTINLDSVSTNEWNTINIECDSLDMNWNSSFIAAQADLTTALQRIYRIDFVFSSRENEAGDKVWIDLDDISIFDY